MLLKRPSLHICFFVLLLLSACATTKKKIDKPSVNVIIPKTDTFKTFNPADRLQKETYFFYRLADKYPLTLQKIIASAHKDSFQILYTEIIRENDQHPVFIQHDLFPGKPNPIDAGMLGKLPLSIAAYQKIRDLETYNITANSSMIVHPEGENLPGLFNDPLSIDGKPSVQGLIRSLLANNNIQSYNALYAFITRDYLNRFLQDDFKQTRLHARAGRLYTAAENRSMNRIVFYGPDNNTLFTRVREINKMLPPIEEKAGNVTTLADIEKMLQNLYFNTDVGSGSFVLTPQQRQSILNMLSQDTRDNKAYRNNAGGNESLLFPHDLKQSGSINKIYINDKQNNRWTEVAYVYDKVKKVEFLLSVSKVHPYPSNKTTLIEMNNMNKLTFQEIGEAVYRYNLSQKRTVTPIFYFNKD